MRPHSLSVGVWIGPTAAAAIVMEKACVAAGSTPKDRKIDPGAIPLRRADAAGAEAEHVPDCV